MRVWISILLMTAAVAAGRPAHAHEVPLRQWEQHADAFRLGSLWSRVVCVELAVRASLSEDTVDRELETAISRKLLASWKRQVPEVPVEPGVSLRTIAAEAKLAGCRARQQRAEGPARWVLRLTLDVLGDRTWAPDRFYGVINPALRLRFSDHGFPGCESGADPCLAGPTYEQPDVDHPHQVKPRPMFIVYEVDVTGAREGSRLVFFSATLADVEEAALKAADGVIRKIAADYRNARAYERAWRAR